MRNLTSMTTNMLSATAVLLLLAPLASAEEVAGKIGYMSGGLIARHADGSFNIMGPKSEVLAGDNLETAKDSYAQVLMNDGTQMTLRPNSDLKIEAYQFKKEVPTEDNAVFRLLKGGFRTVSGLIGKRGNFDAYKLKALTATIGVRGTDFTTRLCTGQDCAEDGTVKPKLIQPVGRVMLIQGELTAKDHSAMIRKLVVGSSVFDDEVLTTGKNSLAIVVFRDEGRVSLQEETIFHVEKFQFERKPTPEAAQENAIFRLLKGGVRVVTGLIGRGKHENYIFRLTTATIGIRGTGFDAWCNASCANEGDKTAATQEAPLQGAGVYVWSGQVALSNATNSQLVSVGQAAILGQDLKPVPVTNVPAGIIQNKTPRPDSVKVDMQKEFENDSAPAVQPTNDPNSKSDGKAEAGVYVTVNDGQIILTQNNGNSVDVAKGQTGYANNQFVARLSETPKFMNVEKLPAENDNGAGNRNNSSILPPQNGCQVK